MRPTQTLYAILTNHGFGHASRSLTVLRELHRQSPHIRILLNTTVPDWFIQSMLGDTPIHYRVRPLDLGIHQKDFLTMDLDRTLTDARNLYESPSGMERVQEEARFALSEGVGLVFADIPPLAVDVAQRAQVPCWMLGNFGWDFIYRYYATHSPGFARIADRISESYQKCDMLFRPSFSEGESLRAVFPRITEVGLTGAVPRFSPEEVLSRLGLSGDSGTTTPLVLLSFGGLGLDGIPYEKLAEFDGRRRPERIFLTFDQAAPPGPNLKIVRDPSLRQIDLLPLVERIISKPGHGTFCEVARMKTPIVCLNRDDFPETPGLLDELRNDFTHRILELPEFFDGDWGFVTDDLTPPRRPLADGSNRVDQANQSGPGDGNVMIARAISDFFAD